MINGSFQFNEYTVTAFTTVVNNKAQLLFPAPGSKLSGSFAEFQWSSGTNVAQYWLEVGTTPNGWEIVSRDMGTRLTTALDNLPTDGRTLYVRVYSYIGGVWQFNAYTLTAAGGDAPNR